MSPYLLSQLPLVVGLFALVGLSSLRPWKNDRASAYLAIGAIFVTLYYVWLLPVGAEYFGGSIRITIAGKAVACIALIFIAVALWLSDGYLEKVHAHPVDWRTLQIILAAGAVNLAFAGDLATLFIAFEIVSILSYAIVGFSRFDLRSNEAGVKYLILGALASGLFLFGLSFLFGATGETSLVAISEKLRTVQGPYLILGRTALALILAALLFKVAAAPFHGWLLDIYQGSSYAALAVVGAPVKVAVFGLLAQFLLGPFAAFADLWRPALAILALLSFLIGGVRGLTQTSLKRILACSAIVNTGFVLLAIAFAPETTLIFYLVVYGAGVQTFAAFMMRLGSREADVDTLDDLNGLGQSLPALGVGLTVLLLSYGGFPPGAGFAAKFVALLGTFQGAIAAGSVLYAIAGAGGAIASVLAIYFYFQMARRIWFSDAPSVGVTRDARWNYALVAGLGAAFAGGGYLFFFFIV